jgi:ferredoxin
MWVHVLRLGRPRTWPPRGIVVAFVAMLLGLALLRPALSEPPWNPSLAPRGVAVDWFYQFLHPLMYATSPALLWILAGGASVILIVLPYLSAKPGTLPARVDPANCNGCGRCVADCPYNAVMLSKGKAAVLSDRCAACGICAGACPSSTPFRSIRDLVSGIELPDLTIGQLRTRMRSTLPGAEVVFCCESNPLPGAIALRCLAMLPPAFVEYALRNGAQTVRGVGCEECCYRLGMDLCDERFAGAREPHLRATVRVQRKANEYRFHLR